MLVKKAAVVSLIPAASLAATSSQTEITIDLQSRYQSVDGFGCSQAFQRAEDIFGKYGLSPKNQSYVLDLMFSRERGAGFTILRNGIGSSNTSTSNLMNSIEPFSPGGPSKPPHYTWDFYNSGQFPLSLEARARGLPYIYADAWSAPGYMKTNQDENWNGYLCGIEGESCPSGDWRQAYANYLVQYVKFYAESGVKVTHLGFLNEPQEVVSYASMGSNGTQAAEFIKILGQTLEREGIDIELTCCDSVGWKEQEDMIPGLQVIGSDGKSAEDYLSIVTGHGYSSAPTFPLSTKRRTWLTEWTDLSGAYTPYTFFADGGAGEGMTWANNVQTAFVNANVSGFVYWIGAENSTTNSGMINLIDDKVIPSKRFWSLASFSKFVRPNAVRVGAVSTNPSVTVINNGSSDASLTINLGKTNRVARTVTPWVTSNDYDLEPMSPINVKGGSFLATVPSRSLTSFVTECG
ncbi:endo-1,6-beta-D-glucanase BGN16.3 precursor, putative [Talaromyces stipitatus ATCC 10500]|uniref:Endo-1,6-beta-D-glucanase BGN16.3, putative n=1 Tax=Talaromyces stipitatus (strain ATCC 10500 / CBS 375.48 / QM 6759 / NRRL 1006) TaxID=441959 RepID=B8M989_TALSN|nr:endo-1,6-beta-D-glucanase BGN16.3 precursor, putative [Talaromyces stipitatus ATCC 10500]EED17384.1 endo-1,6-beta-D-glucanase BGN16.3 precursor, putative [Talaromyces stipitatus ATCC 10500]